MARSLLESFFHALTHLDPFLWGLVGVPLVLGTGFYFFARSRFVQFRIFSSELIDLLSKNEAVSSSFFASVGGAVGIGNVVSVCSMLSFVGPGVVLWFWIGSFFGILLKYAEVYLALRFKTEQNGMVSYLSFAFQNSFVPKLASFFSCIYGIEIYQFNIVRDSIADAWGFPKVAVSGVLLFLIFLAVRGGFQRIGKISSKILPLFIFLYFFMAVVVLFVFRNNLLGAFREIIVGFFDPVSVAPGLGASFLLASSQGLAKGCYATDIGTGYSGMIYSSSSHKNPIQAARLVLLEPCFDSFGVCTLSLLIVLATGVWKQNISASFLVQSAIGTVFPHSKKLMSILLSLLGYSTITAFLAMGIESAKFLSKERGQILYSFFAVFLWILFSFFDAEIAFVFMSLCGFGLLFINVLAFIKLRKYIRFYSDREEDQ